MLGELLFGRPLDFENQRDLIPGVGRHRSVATLDASPRILKSHEPYRREYRKAIYLVRHVADVAVSYYNWLEWLTITPLGFDEFLPLFLSGSLDGYGPWHSHVRSWLEAKDAEILVIRYEDLRINPQGSLERILDFAGAPLEADKISAAIANNTIEKMRGKEERARGSVFKNRSTDNHFVRKGAVGESAVWLDQGGWRLIEEYAGEVLRRLGYETHASQ